MVDIWKETLMTPQEVADYLKRDRRTIDNWIRNGLEAVRAKRSRLIFTSKEAVTRFFEPVSFSADISISEPKQVTATRQKVAAQFGI